MDTKDHIKETNNKMVGKGRTEDHCDLLQYFSQEEKNFLRERTNCANGLVWLSLSLVCEIHYRYSSR